MDDLRDNYRRGPKLYIFNYARAHNYVCARVYVYPQFICLRVFTARETSQKIRASR